MSTHWDLCTSQFIRGQRFLNWIELNFKTCSQHWLEPVCCRSWLEMRPEESLLHDCLHPWLSDCLSMWVGWHCSSPAQHGSTSSVLSTAASLLQLLKLYFFQNKTNAIHCGMENQCVRKGQGRNWYYEGVPPPWDFLAGLPGLSPAQDIRPAPTPGSS